MILPCTPREGSFPESSSSFQCPLLKDEEFLLLIIGPLTLIELDRCFIGAHVSPVIHLS